MTDLFVLEIVSVKKCSSLNKYFYPITRISFARHIVEIKIQFQNRLTTDEITKSFFQYTFLFQFGYKSQNN